jgi:hypothetical protein
MRCDFIPHVFRQDWQPQYKEIDISVFDENLKWCPWGTFNADNVHFFTEDYRFEGLWRRPEFSLKKLLKFNYVIAPDFSLYYGAPEEVNRFQLYRQRVIFSFLQFNGVNVIPCLSFLDLEQIKKDEDFYFKFPVYAVRSPQKDFLSEYKKCMDYFIKKLKIKKILHFGTRNGIDYNCDYILYRLRKCQKRQKKSG